jgi:hypothetical protein
MSDQVPAEIDAAVVSLTRWAAAARTESAADSRVAQRWSDQQAADEASLAGVLLGLAERRAAVAIRLHTGTTVRGATAGVGRDFVAIAHGGQLTLLPTLAIEWVRPDEAAGPAAFGDRTSRTGSLVAVLAAIADEGLPVRLVGHSETQVGVLIGVGDDVLSVRPTGGAAGQVVYVPVASLSEASVRLSG